MLTVSTIPEALAELERRTGCAWTDSELFDLAANCSIELHAAPPITARTTIQKFVIGEGLVEKFRSGPGHASLAVLFPWQVGQLWISGETLTSHTSDHNQIDDEYQLFTEPVRVTREQVRIKAATLEKILSVWTKLQPEPTPKTTTPAPVLAVGASNDGDKGGWVAQAISRGWAIIREADGRWFPTQKDLAKQIEREFGEAMPPILNMHGQPLETSTIERELKRHSVSCKQARAKANINIQGN